MTSEKSRKITGYFIDVQNETHGPRTIEDGLEGYYNLLGCRVIDMPTRKIGERRGRYYTIICDDEGLFAEQPKISAIDQMGRPMLVGNLFIVKTDNMGETQSLNAYDIEYLKLFITMQATRKYPRPYPMICQCEY